MLKSRKFIWIAIALMLTALTAMLLTALRDEEYVPDNRATFVLREGNE